MKRNPFYRWRLPKIVWVGPIACALLLLSCFNDKVAGSASETTNGIVVGQAINEDGTFSSNLDIRLLPTDYNPVTAVPLPSEWSAVADGQGRFQLESIKPGVYNLEITLWDSTLFLKQFSTGERLLIGAALKRTLVKNVEIKETKTRNTIDVGTVFLKKTASLIIPVDSNSMQSGASIYIPGTTVQSQLDPENTTWDTLTGIAEGEYSSLIYWEDSSSNQSINSDVVQLDAGDFRILNAFQDWKFFRAIPVSLGSLSVQSASAVVNFPFYFQIRQPEFSFDDFAANGSDLVVTDVDQNILLHQIVYWDSTEKIGRLYVLLDSLTKWIQVPSLYLFWGNANYVQNNSTSVFDASYGYQGFWSFDSTLNGSVVDFNNNLNPALMSGNLTLTEIIQSPPRSSLALNGSSNYATGQQQLSPSNELTLSLWFKTTSTSGGKLLGFGNLPSSAPAYYDRQIWMDDNGNVHFGVFPHIDSISTLADTGSVDSTVGDSVVFPGVRQILSSNQVYNDGQWHLATATLSDEGQALFVDGVKVSEDTTSKKAAYYSGYWTFGGGTMGNWEPSPTSPFFQGELDDVFVLNRDVGQEWIELYFNNQVGETTK